MWASSTRPLSYEEMVVVEQNAVALGVSLDALMEHAGRVVAEEAARHLPAGGPRTVAVVASTGNNGGDGTCAAHYLAEWGFAPEVWLVRPPSEIRSRPARRCYDRFARRGPVHERLPTSAELAAFPLVIDALLGTGQSDRLRSPIREGAQAIRASGVPVLSIDLPTGTRDPDGVRATWTVALTALKREMDPRSAGEVTVREIGVPEEAWRRTGPGEFASFRPSVRVGSAGRPVRVVVVGGGPYAGAPALAALAALRSGVERATVFAPSAAAPTVQAFSPNLVVRPFGTDRFRLADIPLVLEALRPSPPSAVAMGMGVGADPATIEAMAALYRELAGRTPLVVDADALAVLAAPSGVARREKGAPVIATPNAGEFARLFTDRHALDVDDARREVARAAAERGITLLAKGAPDLISDGELTVENRHHHPAMMVAGAGDVLAGVVTAMLGSGLEAVPAARLAAYWAGEAGMLAGSRLSYGLLATDILDELPHALVDGLARVHPGE
jgi:hydroxyethylthiazole kinase-like uncharacterized protein yjeF